MKKTVCMILAVILTLSAAALTLFRVSAADQDPDMIDEVKTSGTTGECTWRLDGTVLTISGNGKMGNYGFYSGVGNQTPWYDNITQVVLEKGVTTIGKGAFENNTCIRSITLPDTLTGIGAYAFFGCKGLDCDLIIPDSVKIIGEYAFCHCAALPRVTFGSSVRSFGQAAFYGCDALTELVLPDSVQSIGGLAFGNCHSLSTLTIGNGIENIGIQAFESCTALTSVTFGNAVTSITGKAFYDTPALTTVTLPASVTTISTGALGYYTDQDFGTAEKVEGFTIYGYENTAAQSYAAANGFRFVRIGDEPPTAPTTPTEAGGRPLCGDVDGDGKVSILDATAIQRYLVNLPTSEAIGKPIE